MPREIMRDIEGDHYHQVIRSNGDQYKKLDKKEEEEEAEAETQIWKYVFGFTEMAVVKCAIELGIADVLEKNGGLMSLIDLSSTLECPPPSLYRIMRFLSHRKIFKQTPLTPTKTQNGSVVTDPTNGFILNNIGYTQTPLSRRLMLSTSASNTSMASFILLESSPVMLSPWLGLTRRVRDKTSNYSAFDSANGEDVWSYAAEHPAHSNLINDAMACDARLVVPHIVKASPQVFRGVDTLVDVGGGDGTAINMLVQAFPWLRGINFDLPHVAKANASIIPVVSDDDRVRHVGGDMFVNIPKADAAFLMWVLHDWGDDECVEILKKCKEATSNRKDKGKVIIVEAILGEESTTNDDKQLQDVRLMLDMVMMAHTTHGKERTLSEWDYVLKQAGFTHFNVYRIQAVQALIVAFP